MAGKSVLVSTYFILMLISPPSVSAANGSSGIIDTNEPLSIYFATDGGVKRYSLDSSEVKTVVDSSNEYPVGVAFDWFREKIYWNSYFKVFRANGDGTEVETVLSTKKYGGLSGLALDWVSGNIYIVSHDGFILACDGRTTGSFTCAIVLAGQGLLQGIALDPVEGLMYWTKYSSSGSSSILTSGTDGSSPTTLVTGLGDPLGIAIDFSAQRLYWADDDANTIQSSNMQGRDIQTLLQLPTGSHPFGVAVLGTRIYWSTTGSDKLASRSKSGGGTATHYNGTNDIHHLGVVPSIELRRNGKNHCEGHNCPKVCVLTATSFRCSE